MTHHYIVWNPGRTEGFITTDREDADFVRTGVRSQPGVSAAGQAFREEYIEDEEDLTELPFTEVHVPDGLCYLGVDLAKPEPAPPQETRVEIGSAASRFVVEMLDFQAIAPSNGGQRLWQILEAGGIPDGMQVPALLGALRHALGARA